MRSGDNTHAPRVSAWEEQWSTSTRGQFNMQNPPLQDALCLPSHANNVQSRHPRNSQHRKGLFTNKSLEDTSQIYLDLASQTCGDLCEKDKILSVAKGIAKQQNCGAVDCMRVLLVNLMGQRVLEVQICIQLWRGCELKSKPTERPK